MPTIRSRKYPEHDPMYVTADVWEVMKKKGLARRYVVVDDDDMKETVIPAPEKIFDVGKPESVDNPVENTVENIVDIPDESDMTVSQLKNWFNEHEVEYPAGAKKAELFELYLEKIQAVRNGNN